MLPPREKTLKKRLDIWVKVMYNVCRLYLQTTYIKDSKGGNMERVNVYLTERQRKRLKKQSDELGISFSELVRRALDAWLLSEQDEQGDQDNES